MKFKLLYRASGKNYTNVNFHSKCDNIPHTIVIMKSDTGKIFGGYADQTWDNSNGYKISSKVFIFDLKEKKQYLQVNTQSNSMYCAMTSGPVFGHRFDFNITENVQNLMASPFGSQSSDYLQALSKNSASYKFNLSTFVEKGQIQVPFGGFQKEQVMGGTVDCVEVFQLEYPGIPKVKPYVPVNQSGKTPTAFVMPAAQADGLFGSGLLGNNTAFNFGGQPNLPLNQADDFGSDSEEEEAE